MSPHPWGLVDGIGNVSEWCEDWHGSHPDAAVVDPTGPESGSERVFRGGSWGDHAGYCRVAARGGYSPRFRDFHLGFRLPADLDGDWWLECGH